jgi:error-prone DNA polymerase
MKLSAPKGAGALALEDLDGVVGGLVALAGRAVINGPRYGVGGLVDRLVGTFGSANVCVELQRHLLRDEEADNYTLRDLASAFHLPVIASNGVRFADVPDRPLYDVLTCIRHKTTLEHAGRRLSWNAERYLKPADAMTRLFTDLPEAIAGTRELADRLEYTMADLGYRFPEYPVPPGETMASFLRKIAQAGARERYRPYHDRARAQISRELNLIEKLDLAGYFLIVWDIVNFCRQEDILVQGRGSAANSAVCYSLGITAVDPVGMDLLFERFLSEERGEWPDIDLDLPSGDRRERVIQHVYEKYGKHGAAMTANVITYRGRSAAREVGKALSLDTAQIDRLAKVMNHFEWVDPKETLERNLRDVGIDGQHPGIQRFGELWTRIQDLPRHLGQHSGGMVICQGRLDAVVPLENASMPDRVVIQWDKDDCADMGLVKVDLLGLGMMAVLQDALTMVNTSGAPAARAEGESASPEVRASGGGAPRALSEDALTLVNSGIRDQGSGNGESTDGRESITGVRNGTVASPCPDPRSLIPDPRSPIVDLAHLPADDPAVYTMLQEADTIGIFQVESRAQMATLPRLRPKCFYDIVVEVAIIRPGPIVGQMVHPYLKRRQGVEAVVYPHPALEPILARTMGVPLFQEQLLRMAMVAAGFSGGEAEELRRAMGFKRSEKRMQQLEGRLRSGMAREGIVGEPAEAIIRSITSFALYGFPESHAASFALLVYASAYLKAHYPAAFYTALLNNQPMGFYHPATLVKDAQRRGVRFSPIDVQESDWECRVDPDGRVRLGLMYVNGLRAEVGKRIGQSSQDASSRDVDESGAVVLSAAPAAAPSANARGASEHSLEPPLSAGARSGSRGGGAPRLGEKWGPASTDKCGPMLESPRCPKCGNDDSSMIEETPNSTQFCNVCAHEWGEHGPSAGMSVAEGQHLSMLAGPHPRSLAPQGSKTRLRRGPQALEDLIVRTGLRRDELATLAEIGALNAFGHDRRSALWQIERAVRSSGEMFREDEAEGEGTSSPLRAMTPIERVRADYAGTSLTIGPHPMALCRGELALRGVQRASDLAGGRSGRRVRVAGAVITRQRPGTAKGFVFLTLEDETGIANIIVRPDLFTDERTTVIGAPYLLVEGTLQIQDGVTSVKAERFQALSTNGPEPQSHDYR